MVSGLPWAWLWLLVASALKLALLPLGLYASTDFEVHRNWLAITHSLPFSKWYFENTSEWTLDYPPLFAVFEWVLAHVAVYADPAMLVVSNLGYASDATIMFQRCTVIAVDVVLFLGAWRLGSVISKSRAGGGAAASAAVLFSPGLILVDHVHFQYNGMLLGLLLFSIADVEDGRTLRAAVVFSVLLNMKQIFLYLAPVYFVYMLRGYCGCSFGRGPLGVRLDGAALAKLALAVLSVFACAWAPLVLTGQAAQAVGRLFPFGRGLTHAYWAPNVWALYNTADRALAKAVGGAAASASSTAGFAEVYTSSVLWTVPPKATFALVLLAYFPLARLIWRQTAPGSAGAGGRFALYAALGSAASFALGWHVHEKAILMVTVPAVAAAAVSVPGARGAGDELRAAVAALSVVATFSLLPLMPARAPETAFKWALALAGHAAELRLLRPRGDWGVGGYIGMLGIGPAPGWAVLGSVFLLGAYVDFGGHRLFFGAGRMEFLPLLCVSDFCAVLVLCSFWRLFRVTQRL